MHESEIAQSWPTLRDPMDCSLPGSSVHGIFQVGVLEWVAIAFSMERCYKPVTEEDNFHLGFWSCIIIIQWESPEASSYALWLWPPTSGHSWSALSWSHRIVTAGHFYRMGFAGGSDGQESACSAGHLCSLPGTGRSPGEGNGNPLQYSCLENLKDKGAWSATVHGVAKSWTWLSDFSFFLSTG